MTTGTGRNNWWLAEHGFLPNAPTPDDEFARYGEGRGVTPYSQMPVSLTPFELANRGASAAELEAARRPPPPFRGSLVNIPRFLTTGTTEKFQPTTLAGRLLGPVGERLLPQQLGGGNVGLTLEDIQRMPAWEQGLTGLGFVGPEVGVLEAGIRGIRPAVTAAQVGAQRLGGTAARAVEAATPAARQLATGERGLLQLRNPSPAELPDAVVEATTELALRKEAIDSHPAKQLMRTLVYREGKNEGQAVPDALAMRRFKGRGYDSLAKELGYDGGGYIPQIGPQPSSELMPGEKLKWDLENLYKAKVELRRDKIILQNWEARLKQGEQPRFEQVAQGQPPGTAMQAGMGIGEKPPQGQLFGEARFEPTTTAPLIDAEQQAQRAAIRAQEAAGQARLPEAAPVSSMAPRQVIAPMPAAATTPTLEKAPIRPAASPAGSGGLGLQLGEGPVTGTARIGTELLEPVPQATEKLTSPSSAAVVPPSAAVQLPPPRAEGGPPTVPPPAGVSGPPNRPPAPPVSPADGLSQPPDDWRGVVDRLTANIRAAKPARAETEALYSAERSQRIAAYQSAINKATTPEEVQRAQGLLGGTLPRAQFTLPEVVQPDEIMALYNRIGEVFPPYRYEHVAVRQALDSLLAGDIPGRGALKGLEKVFGSDLISAILSKRSLTQRGFEEALDAMNIPRSLMSSADISAPLRQGAVLSAGHPVIWAKSWGPMLKAMARENWAQAVDDTIRSRPLFDEGERAGLYLADFGGVATKVAEREELFMSRLIQRIPDIAAKYGARVAGKPGEIAGRILTIPFASVRASERAYTAFLNKLRSDVFDSVVNGWKEAGEEYTDIDTQKLARFVNWATGRGPLPNNDIAAMLNAPFFAPRLVTSRIMLPTTLITSTPLVRQEAARTLVGFVGTGMAVLGLAKLAGADVEDNPESPDFGRVRMGGTRLDFWAGFQPLARYSAQILMGQAKELPESGAQTHDVNRLGRALRFVWSKMAPVPSYGIGAAYGKDFQGNPMDYSLSGFGKAAINNFTSLFAQDMHDAFNSDGLVGLAKASPSGAGVTTLTVNPDAIHQYWAAVEDMVPAEVKPMWDKYHDLPPRDRRDYLSRIPSQDSTVILGLLKMETTLRLKMRRDNPDLDSLLVQQYNYKPKTPQGIQTLQGVRESQLPSELRRSFQSSPMQQSPQGQRPVPVSQQQVVPNRWLQQSGIR